MASARERYRGATHVLPTPRDELLALVSAGSISSSSAQKVPEAPLEAGRGRGAAEGDLADVFEYFDIVKDVLGGGV